MPSSAATHSDPAAASWLSWKPPVGWLLLMNREQRLDHPRRGGLHLDDEVPRQITFEQRVDRLLHVGQDVLPGRVMFEHDECRFGPALGAPDFRVKRGNEGMQLTHERQD